MGYIYLLQPVEFFKTNKNVYKIGKTNQENTINRLRNYDRHCKLIIEIYTDNCNNHEKKILELFKTNFTQYTEGDYENSLEYFSGDVKKMLYIIHSTINDFNGPIDKPQVSFAWRMLGY